MTVTVPLHSTDEERALLGPSDGYARAIRNRFDVTLAVRNGRVFVDGEDEAAVSDAVRVVRELLDHIRNNGGQLEESQVLKVMDVAHTTVPDAMAGGPASLPPNVVPRSKGQERFVRSIIKNTITFAIGPAGTGKTYLAAAVAVSALRRGQFKKLVLVRPAVEAGENLGFLPGDLVAKINPYLRPLYDSLQAHLEQGRLQHFIETDVVEIVPLAYMRGRTLDDCFILLDEGQNTTRGQMKMFLTRMGNNSKIVVTGDLTQVDLPRSETSGLREAERLLGKISGVGMIHLESRDIVRHPLVQKIVNAYDANDRRVEERTKRR